MCSTPAQRVAEIGQAIDELAADALAAADGDRETAQASAELTGPGTADADQVMVEVARLWSILAELDPEVSRRLPGYLFDWS